MSRFVAKLRQVLQSLLHQTESVDVVLNSHVKGSCDGSLFEISVNMEILLVCSALCKLVNQLRISVESEYNRLILSEQQIEFLVCKTVRMIQM